MPIQSFTTKTGYSVQALDLNIQAMSLAGYAVKSGCAVTLNTGTLGSGNSALQVSAGTIRHNATDVTVSGQNVDIGKGGDQPRKDVVYVDANGSALVRTGKPQEPDPTNAVRTQAESPSPDPFDDYGGTVLAEIWVGKNATTITADDVLDRRVAAVGDGHTHAHSNLTGIGASDHHAKYTDTEAVNAVEAHPSALTIDITGGAQTTQGNLDTHTADTNNPHSVTASQLSAMQTTGGTFTGTVNFGSATDGDVSFVSGGNPATTITETAAPKGFGFTASATVDTHVRTDVTISNASGASATETITVELYDGVDATGTLVDSESRSITVANGASSVETFIATEQALDTGDYYINVTQSGTALTVDQTDEYTKGAEFTFAQSATGVLAVTTQDAVDAVTIDPRTANVDVPTGTLSEAGNAVWHAGNFDPSTKADLAGASFTGNVDLGGNNLTTVGGISTDVIPGGAAALDVEGQNNDANVWYVGNGGNYGFMMRYMGSGTGDANSLQLLTDDLANAGELPVFEVMQSGNIDFKQATSVGGDTISRTPDGNAVEFYVSSTAPTTSNPYVRFEP